MTMKADWTNRDAAISVELNRYGRSGVPLYLFYPPRQSAVVLPQLLTPTLVLNVLDKAPAARAVDLHNPRIVRLR